MAAAGEHRETVTLVDDAVAADAAIKLEGMEGESRFEAERVEDSDQVVGIIGAVEPAVRRRAAVFVREVSGPFGGAPQARSLGPRAGQDRFLLRRTIFGPSFSFSVLANGLEFSCMLPKTAISGCDLAHMSP